MILHLSHYWLPVAAEFALNKMNCLVVIIQMFIFLIAGRFAAHCKQNTNDSSFCSTGITVIVESIRMRLMDVARLSKPQIDCVDLSVSTIMRW